MKEKTKKIKNKKTEKTFSLCRKLNLLPHFEVKKIIQLKSSIIKD